MESGTDGAVRMDCPRPRSSRNQRWVGV